jgi:hypothetical protein
MKTKICKTCGIEKDRNENFKKRGETPNGKFCYHSECKVCNKIRRQTPKGRFDTYRESASRKNLEFELALQDFEDNWNKECHYCGDAIPTIGFDRIDSNKGYVKSNLVLCCTTCNAMKSNLDTQTFLLFCKKISQKHP